MSNTQFKATLQKGLLIEYAIVISDDIENKILFLLNIEIKIISAIRTNGIIHGYAAVASIPAFIFLLFKIEIHENN